MYNDGVGLQPKKPGEAESRDAEGRKPAPDTTSFSSIDVSAWQDYDYISTDSLWVLGKRDSTGAHAGDYHGNFVPQIPRQIIERFSKLGEWVVDPFCGSGTTLIEAQRLGRNAVGIELNRAMVKTSRARVKSEPNPDAVCTKAIKGDSANKRVWERACGHLPKDRDGKFDLAILHPPYDDIIKFNDDPRCLSNQAETGDFLKLFGSVVELTRGHLADERFLALVIGDKYAQSEWIPLGFRCMDVVLDAGFALKSIIVKDIQDNRAKRNQENLWRVRALRGGFYIFKHEYIMLFRKTAD